MARWTDYQLSRLETVFAVIVLLVILSAILNRAVIYLTLAEQVLVDNVVTNINAALRLSEAHYVAEGRQHELANLAGINPVKLIESRPADYAKRIAERVEHQALLHAGSGRPLSRYEGEFDHPDPADYPRGSWYFDSSDKVLVYMVRNRELFHSPLEGPERIRFRVMVDYADRNGNGRYDAGVDQYRGVQLKALNQYEWLIQG